jgi:regulator of protease activity HflC (stomatin/prohibitin superfamily)
MKTPDPTKRIGIITASPAQFLVHFRRGRPMKAARGGTAFCLPYLDRCVLVPGTAHRVEFCADQITEENQGIEVAGFAVWRIEEPLRACATFDFSAPDAAVLEVGEVLQGVVESATRHQVARMKLDDVIRQRSSIIAALKKEVEPLSGEWGIVLDTVEIRTVKIFSRQLFENLQAKYRDQARLAAVVSALETERAISEQRCREEILRIKAEMETREATEELDLRKARHAFELAGIEENSERRRIETSNTRDRVLTALDRLPEIASNLPLKNVEIRADMLGDLVRAFSRLATTGLTESPTLKE